ncbi:unnamed protein product [Symbiodinium sp. CCMP2592]|nr:unnamed protein product [Symbiodinium sp. CCMP2592]
MPGRRSKSDAQDVPIAGGADRGSKAKRRKSRTDGPQDPRQRQAAELQTQVAPSPDRFVGRASSDEESLPSAPSQGHQSERLRTGQVDSKPRRVLVARQDPPRAVLRPQREDRARLKPANALVLKSNAQVTEKASDKDREKRRTKEMPLAAAAGGKTGGPKSSLPKGQKSLGPVNAVKEKKQAKQQRSEGDQLQSKKLVTRSSQRQRREESQEVKPKSNKQKKEKKKDNKVRKEKSRSPTQTQERRKSLRKDKKRKQPGTEKRASARSPSLPKATPEFQASERGARGVPRLRDPAGSSHRRSKQATAEDVRADGRRREHRSARSPSRKRRCDAAVPEAWQVWRAGSYHPWSAQLAGAPLGAVWSVPGMMAPQAWALASGIPHAGHAQAEGALPISDSSEEAEDEEEEEEEEEEEQEGEDESEPEDAAQVLAAVVPGAALAAPLAVQGTSAAAAGAAGAAQEGSESSESENEESETESQDEDAEIGEAPIAPKSKEGDGGDGAEAERPPVASSAEPKVLQWVPPFRKARQPLHRSAERWPGPKVGWSELYELEVDLNLVKGNIELSSKRHISRSEGLGKGLTDMDASDIEEFAEANPSEAEATAEGTARTVPLIPHWSKTRSWTSIQEVLLEEAEGSWQQRRLCSVVLRSRRKGRSSGGSPAVGVANPQEPPENLPDACGSTLLLTIGAAARAVRLMQWRSPPLLDVPEALKVDPSKYRGNERNLRMRKRPAAKAKKAAAYKSIPQGPPPKAPSEEYKSQLRSLMQKVQGGSSERDAVRDFWSDLSPADRVQFSTEFPQFMHLVVGLPSAIDTDVTKAKSDGLPGLAPPPPKTPAELTGMATTASSKSLPVPFASATGPGLGTAFVAPVPIWPKGKAPGLSAEVFKKQEAAWADRLTFHDGILRVDMRSLQLMDVGMVRWCRWAPALLQTLGRAGGTVSEAEFDFSGNALEDGGLRELLALLQNCDVHLRTLNLNANRLTEASLVAISDLISKSRLPISAVLMENNRVQGSYGLMNLVRALKSNAQYPILREDTGRYTPLMLHLAGNMIERPMQVTQLVKEAFDNRFPSTSEERQYWEVKQQCPPLQLPMFEKQETSAWQ